MAQSKDSKQKTLKFIEEFYQKHGTPAMIPDIMAEIGFKSTRSVTRYYDEFEKEGLIRRHRGHAIPTRFKIIRLFAPAPRRRALLARTTC